MNKFFVVLGSFILGSCLLFSSPAQAKDVVEDLWTTHQTVNNATLETPADFQFKPIDNLVSNDQKILGQGFSSPTSAQDSLSFFILYSVPVDPKDIKNFRFRYDFRSSEAVEAFATPLQKNFDNTYRFQSQWSLPVTKKINDKTVLILKGTVLSRQGEPVLYHEHYNWSCPTTSETYTITFIYKEKSKTSQKEIQRIISSFQYSPTPN